MSTQTSTQASTQQGGSAKDRAAQVGGTAREQTAQVAGTTKEQAADVAHDAAAQARDLLGELRMQLRQQTDQQRQHIAELLREFGDELEHMARAGGGSGTATEVVRQAAQRLRSVQSYVEGSPNVGSDLRGWARRKPGAFLFGAVVAGVLAGRATRGAAAARREDQAAEQGDYGYTGGSGYGNGYGNGSGYGTTYGTGSGYPAYGEPGYTQSGYAGQAGNVGFPGEYGAGRVVDVRGTGTVSGPGVSDTPIGSQVAEDIRGASGTGPQYGTTSTYAVPQEPRTLDETEQSAIAQMPGAGTTGAAGVQGDELLGADPNLGPATGGSGGTSGRPA